MIPYRPDLKQVARRLRRDATVPERLLWSRLRRRALGVRFLRQRPIGPYVVDFYCPDRHLVVEVDGRSHDGRGAEDADRQRFLESNDLVVYRVTNDEVVSDLEETVRQLEAWIVNRE
ncbi:MAG: hypothetical protein Rubg2KO_04020 [Rubricoccaceae bacterium]